MLDIVSLVRYKGSHGTSLSKCRNIVAAGFKLGAGRAGRGIYFWVESVFYLELAQAWFKQKRAEGEYDEENPECTIIIASVEADEKEYIDLEDNRIRDQVIRLGNKMGLDLNDDGVIERLFNLFVVKTEEKLGYGIKMISIRVGAPKGFKYPLRAAGAPLCCVARIADCVKINKYGLCEEMQYE